VKNAATKIDDLLIDRVLARDPASQLAFVNSSEKLIYGALNSFGGLSRTETEDLFQAVFLKLFEDDMRRIRLWNREAKFTTYLYRIVVNLVKDHFGSAAYKHLKLKAREDEDGRSPLELLKAPSAQDSRLDKLSLAHCLNQLKPGERQIIELYYFQDLKEREIATLLNKPLNTVSSLKNRTLKKLKKIIEENFA